MESIYNRRKFIKKAIIGGSCLTFASPLLISGRASQSTKINGISNNPYGIVTGGFDPNDPKYGVSLSTDEIDGYYKIKSSEDGWYGDQVVNPYIRPGINHNTNFVGSKDVNEDGLFDFDDVLSIQQGNTSYCGDANGDGLINNLDAQIIEEVLNSQREYAPCDWHYLKTVAERIEWYEKMLQYYNKMGQNRGDGWTCGEFMYHFLLAFAGLENVLNYGDFSYFFHLFNRTLLVENGKINLPVYTVLTVAKDGQGHFINGIFIGSDDPEKDTPTEFDSWYFIEPQLGGRRVYPGDFSMNETSNVGIKRLCYYWSWTNNRRSYTTMPLIYFHPIQGQKYEANWQNPYLVTERPFNPITGIGKIKSYTFELQTPYPSYLGNGSDLYIPWKPQSFESVNVEIYNLTGQNIYSQNHFPSGSKIVISNGNLSKIKTGNYSILVKTSSGEIYTPKKLIAIQK